MFLLKFNLQILYKSDKSHIMLNVLSYLLNHNNINRFLNMFDINAFYVYNDSVVIMSKNFSKYI